ncbi:hypothetical protein D1825_09000 [Cellulomonas rhizosphaerae]|uniref:Uncharacterized protein n=1 Tax=Cellulomonas rhizosphaerae TaxID=2293719 RepID=A0A413RLV5_9CELL|nr:hypothetical protein D1825_09000 [Cellulomonas rhizosphaerae]
MLVALPSPAASRRGNARSWTSTTRAPSGRSSSRPAVRAAHASSTPMSSAVIAESSSGVRIAMSVTSSACPAHAPSSPAAARARKSAAASNRSRSHSSANSCSDSRAAGARRS